MKYNNCIKCNSEEYTIKSATLTTMDTEKNIFNRVKNEMFYIKICSKCGYTEIYDAKLVDKCVKKQPKGI